VSEVALGVGHKTPSSFNKAVRLALGLSPTALRAASAPERRELVARLAARPRADPELPPLRLSRTPEMRRRPARRFIYARELGTYSEVAPLAWSRLSAKLGASGISMRAHERVGVSYDDPHAVSEELLRYDAGLVVAPGVKAPPGTSVGRLEGGDYAVFEHCGSYRHIERAFAHLFAGWVVRSGARVRPAPCLELYRNQAIDVPEHELLTELLIPVESSR
jgi:AraC family transcriptional regulator